MALYRTPSEVAERYTEPWPADLIPDKVRDCQDPRTSGTGAIPARRTMTGTAKRTGSY